MAWDKTNGAYYRSHRRGKKVVREYFGKGEAGRLAAAIDDCRRRRKLQDQDAVAALRQICANAAQPLTELCEGIALMMRGVRLFARADMASLLGCTVTPAADDVLATLRELRDLVALAENGDRCVLPQIKFFLTEDHHIAEHFAAIARTAAERWLALYAGGNVVIAELVRKKMIAGRAALTGWPPSPLDAVMIEQVVVCWLRSHYAAVIYAQALAANVSDGIAREIQRQQDAGQHALALSLRQLAELRRLMPMQPFESAKLRFPTGAMSDGSAGCDSSEQPDDL